jgi:(1->4)-alpha-D-glucan 1-alpha-D-glucosylmutase
LLAKTAMPRATRTPLSTYRVQWQTDFGFREALAITPYLEALGITDLYVPPVAKAQRGSLHGYAVVDPSVVNPELGTEDDLLALGRSLAARRMGLVVDLVPNHMGIAGGENRFFVDVLENGRCSVYADLFDIEWDPPKEALEDKLLLPVLGEQYGDALASGKLRVTHRAGDVELDYGALALPLEPMSLVPILESAAGALSDGDDKSELMSIAASFRHLPPPSSSDPASREERSREKEIGKRRLRELVERSAPVSVALDAEIATYTNGRLDALLREQCYRPCFWRVALEATNYRRFFDVNDLAAIRVELPWVFDTVHELAFRLVREGAVHGLRIDHVDGLYNPRQYLSDLSAALERETPPGAPHPWVIVEKILEPGELLPESFACEGTTGYDFARLATGILIDPAAQSTLESLYHRITRDLRSFGEIAVAMKRFTLEYILSSEVAMLTRALERIADADPRSRDFSRKSLESAIVGTMACFPVYRTYVEPDGTRSESDVAHIERAIAGASRRHVAVDRSVFAFLRGVLLGRSGGADADPADHEARVAFAMKFQQTTGPVMAKAIEDTAFYAMPMFLAANEVGSDPSHIGVELEAFHRELGRRAERSPRGMNATSTHDTKRSEDVRARLAVLSEMPEEWRSALARWRRVAKRHRARVGTDVAPSPEDELAFFQTVVGAAPFGVDRSTLRELAPRLRESALKAAKEAKQRTSWLQPDEDYEAAIVRFIDAMLADDEFAGDVVVFCRALDPHGASNALAQCAVKLLAPGVPDFYQGSEIWHQRLVDPDNRCPVDFAALRGRLLRLREDGRSKEERARAALARYVDGDVKLLVTSEGLALRRSLPRLFVEGAYVPLSSDRHALAFARTLDDREASTVIAVAARLPRTLLQGEPAFATGTRFGDRRLRTPRALQGTYEDRLTGVRVVIDDATSLARILATLPVALLRRIGRP